jgi:hypothetical protein
VTICHDILDNILYPNLREVTAEVFHQDDPQPRFRNFVTSATKEKFPAFNVSSLFFFLILGYIKTAIYVSVGHAGSVATLKHVITTAIKTVPPEKFKCVLG